MRVVHVCSEIYPLIKTGGLADVAAALPPALVRCGCDVRLLLPGYPVILEQVRNPQMLVELPPRFGASRLRLYAATLPGSEMPAYVIDAHGLYDRHGNPYADARNQEYADNYRRFALLGWMAAELAHGLDPVWRPDIVHGHDWHAGLAPAYLKAAERRSGRIAASVMTIHNLAYQGVYSREVFHELDLPPDFFDMYGVEFYGNVSFLKAGLFYADKLTTVSPTYAREIQGSEQGCGLEGLLSGRAQDLAGILNGVDPEVWNPETDAAIAANYGVSSLERKRECRRALQQQCGLAMQDTAPVFGVVSRLTDQKGLHLVLDALPDVIQRGGQLVLLGSGDAELETGFLNAAAAHPEAVSVQIGYDEGKSHQIIASCDVVLVPSRYEPCGLTQLYGLRYGTLPLVRRVGGLADSVVDASPENQAAGMATGIVFEGFNTEQLATAMRCAFALFSHHDAWQRVQQTGMRQQFTWDRAAAQMIDVYRQIMMLEL
ncbi:glycogen synthase GlgA [Noviherbaspirillum sp. Root189]|uniref:glycogen synthase GlgA n=1 Tax=Noviherbaspirillum sp. Root189 TaxID=1736487 RepID=UPI00070FD8D9|nr:glycogen synthase GlgA [Noviherbaspirillum sp. Root189]KRB67928.1 glycogen synthase [Noviherbaspirillum sp. Root189]